MSFRLSLGIETDFGKDIGFDGDLQWVVRPTVGRIIFRFIGSRKEGHLDCDPLRVSQLCGQSETRCCRVDSVHPMLHLWSNAELKKNGNKKYQIRLNIYEGLNTKSYMSNGKAGYT